MHDLKLKVSTKILDFVEGLPRFRKGLISGLQDIRERQKKWASDGFAARSLPKESIIEFSRTTLVLTFEHEDFYNVIKGLKQYFPKNEKIQKFVKTLKESIDSLHVVNWHNLGHIVSEQGVYFPDVVVDANLPESVENVSLSFHRILPSVACIIFEFQLKNTVSEELKRTQGKKYLGPLEFKTLWPLKGLRREYTFGSGTDSAINAINSKKSAIRKDIEKWVKSGFSWKPQTMDAVSYIDVYKISGTPLEADKRRSWLFENNTWLNEFGIDVNGFDTLEGGDFLVSKPRSSEEEFTVSDVVAKFDSKNESEFGDFLELKVRAIAVSATIINVIEKYSNIVEFLSGNGFKNLYKRKKLTLRNQNNIQELKRTIVILSRLEHELDKSGHWISHSISAVAPLKTLVREKPVNLGEITISNAKNYLNQVKKSAGIIDSGLTNYLSMQSIYVMYKLQKWMFILSIVITIATIISVLTGWDELESLIKGWLNL